MFYACGIIWKVCKRLNSKRNFENKMSNCLNNKMKVIALHDKWGDFYPSREVVSICFSVFVTKSDLYQYLL